MLQRRLLYLVVCFSSLFEFIRAQDIIYLNNGVKVEANVKELNVVSIKYKNFANPDGPTYVVNRQDVLLIQYQNGTVEIINNNPTSVSPPNAEAPAPKKEKVKKSVYDAHYLNKNCIYFNGIALTNSDLAFIYDREFAKSRFSLVLLGAYNFNVHTNYTNSYIQALHNSKKNYDIGAGINYYTQARKKTQYFVGVLFKYMNYEYVRETSIEESLNGLTYTIIKQENVNNYQFAGLLVNGLQFRITPFFTYRTFIGLGATNADSDLSKAVKEDLTQKARPFVKAYLGMCVGYRFY